ncbi:MAG: hypothetical protein RR448_02225 [Niameybacter sp.]|uniref:hypothetical protein n=1 Tax=Niameybacter sp. TaxID=2033640 RepID=UPI002FC63BF8
MKSINLQKASLEKCNEAYVLADISKVDAVSFAKLKQPILITNASISPKFYEQTTIIEVDNKYE